MNLNSASLRRLFHSRLEEKQDSLLSLPGILGNGSGRVETGTPNIVYVQIAQAISTAVCTSVPHVYGLPVWVGYTTYDPTTLQVISQRVIGGMSTGEVQTGVAPHAQTHEYMGPGNGGGTDVVKVHLPQFMPFRVFSMGDLIIAIHPGIIQTSTGWVLIADTNVFGMPVPKTLDLTFDAPSIDGRSRFVLITINSQGSITKTLGQEVETATLSLNHIPVVPSDSLMTLAAIHLYEGQTTITENRDGTDIVDLRFPGLQVPGTISDPGGTPINYVVANLSNPPTQEEFLALLGPASASPRVSFIVEDTSTSRIYWVISTGEVFAYSTLSTVAPAVVPPVNPINQPTNAMWFHMSQPILYYDGKTYLAYLTSAKTILAVTYDHTTDEFSDPSTISTAQADMDLQSPTIFIRDNDERVLAFYSRSDGDFKYFYKISTSAKNITSWGPEKSLVPPIPAPSSGDQHTQVIQMLNEGLTPIYLFINSVGVNDAGQSVITFGYIRSTDYGETWENFTEILSSLNGFVKVVKNGDDRIDFVYGYQYDPDGPGSLHHVYRLNGSWYKSDGTAIPQPPLTVFTQWTEIYSVSNYVQLIDLQINSSGNPVILYADFVTSSDVKIYRGEWSGSAWVSKKIVDAGAYLKISGGCIDPKDVNSVYLPIPISGQLEIIKYVTTDSGDTWTPIAITTGSTVKNIRPIMSRDYQTDLKVLWLSGTYTDISSWSMTTGVTNT